MYMVHTRLYSFTTTLPTQFTSHQARSALLRRRVSGSAPRRLRSFRAAALSSLLAVISLLNWQTTQARLATSKLSQPRVYLIHIAATPAIRCCSVTGAPKQARPLVLAVLVRNGRGWVTSQEPVSTTGQNQYELGLFYYVQCTYIACTCSYSVYTCTYIVRGYHILYPYIPMVYTTAVLSVLPL